MLELTPAQPSYRPSSHRALARMMEFDHVITVRPHGTLSDAVDGLATPEGVYDYLDATGDSHDDLEVPGGDWELLTGFTGQYSYHGPVMHPSEIIAGNLADHILNNPGHYVALIVTGIHADDCACDSDEYHGEDSTDSDIYGWAVAYSPLKES